MLWYVAFISVLNLGLGYALAIYLGVPSRRVRIDVAGLKTWLSFARATAPQNDEAVSTPPAAQLPTGGAAPPARAVSSAQASEPADIEPTGSSADGVQTADDGQELPEPTAPPIMPPALDPDTGLFTRQFVEQILEEQTGAAAGRGPISAALVEIAWSGQVNQNTKPRLLHGVADTVRQLFGHRDTAARFSDQQFLLLLPDDSVEQAAQRVEQLRQRVEATKYVANGVNWPTTLTCALAEVSRDADHTRLLENLDEALAEAKRYGGNRTFMHDGVSPTPVVPLELGLAAQPCTV